MKEQKSDPIPIRSMKDRRYAQIPVDQITVMNPRERDQKQFGDNVKSIESIGLMKPVVVNERFFEKSGKYELVCGEGRLIAHQKLGKAKIEAEVVDVDRKQAHLMSLIENIARVPPGTVWFAAEVKRMHDAGMGIPEISRIVARCESYVSAYIRLAEKGEVRLIRGVEKGLFPMAFARRVAESGGNEIQNILMDAYDGNIVTTANFSQVKRILMARLTKGNSAPTSGGGHVHASYTLGQLKRDITRVTRDKETYVKEAERKENRLFAIIGAMETVAKDVGLLALLEKEGISERPVLAGRYGSWKNEAEVPNGDEPYG